MNVETKNKRGQIMSCNNSIQTEWMTAEEAAGYLKIERKTLLAWVRRGQIRAYHLSGNKRCIYRFRQQDLDASMAVTAVYQNSVIDCARSSALSPNKEI